MKPKCIYFGKCGGCSLQNLEYGKQIELKEKKLKEIFGFKIEVLPSKKIYSYRNRIDIPITKEGIGFKKKGSWKEIVPIERCEIFGNKSDRAINELKRFITDFKLESWDLIEHKGFLRYIVLRESKFCKELMVNLVTAPGDLPEPVDYFKADSIYWCVNEKITDISIGKIEQFWKNQFIKEKLNNIVYLIGPNSFFQANPFVTKDLIKEVHGLVENENILDAYCGIGTFSLYLAKKGLSVKGFDNDKEAIEIAMKNSDINKVEVDFFVQEDRKIKELNCETLIVDPPRPGLHPKFLKTIKRSMPKEVIYVSCNPLSLKKDIEALNYEIEIFKAFDMFPQTEHIECVVKLKRK
ncbi:MAG: 23S rRNA (uracil(1939)-C(5))-methyltransferase RlmD [Candidatus Pacearchaeota archaeon]|nr:23S rRNA (uracil(1939)-C(5))-methyltransferase RlmD [Candidatus Pacearchaeota archaeon]